MRTMASAAVLALTTLAAPAQAQDVADGAVAALSARLFPLFDAARRNPAAIARIAGTPGMQRVLAVRRDRRAGCGTDLVCRA